jgi:hypothetical protein
MPAYQIQLREMRLATDGTDDVAIFDVVRKGDKQQVWHVPAYLTPLFRIVQMELGAPAESRQDMVAGLGARAIIETLKKGVEPPIENRLVFAIDYPGAPGLPNPMPDYEDIDVYVEET